MHPDFHACGFVEELDCGGDFVDILASRSLGGGDVLVDIVCPVDVDFDGFGFGEHGDGAGGGVDPALGFGGGDSLDGVDTGFKREALPDAFAFEVEDGVADAPH